MKKIRILGFVLTVVALAAFPLASFAAPVIDDNGVSGVIIDGATITIAGSGFGEHPNYDVFGSGFLCSMFDDFESYSNINDMYANYTIEKPGSVEIDYSADRVRGARSLYADGSGGGGSKTRPIADPFDLGGKWYWSNWLYLPADFQSVSENQWKGVRFFDGRTRHDFYYSVCSRSGGDFGHHSDSREGYIGETEDFFKTDGSNVQGSPFPGSWHRIEFVCDVDNDILNWYVDGHKYYDGAALSAQEGMDLFQDGYWQKSWMEFPSIDEVHQPVYNGNYDDLVANNTWARVEIAQNPGDIGNGFYCSNQMRIVKNYQPPIAWSNDSIQIKLDLEGLSGTVYLYVVDANGEVSDPYPITIGEDPEPPAPNFDISLEARFNDESTDKTVSKGDLLIAQARLTLNSADNDATEGTFIVRLETFNQEGEPMGFEKEAVVSLAIGASKTYAKIAFDTTSFSKQTYTIKISVEPVVGDITNGATEKILTVHIN